MPLHEQVWHVVSFCELRMVLSRFTDCISTYWLVSNYDVLYFKWATNVHGTIM